MTTHSLRNKLHNYIDSAEEKKLKAIYTMVENEIEESSLLTAEQKLELDRRLEEYMQGKGKNYSWASAMKKIKSSVNPDSRK